MKNLNQRSFNISDMHCASCVSKVQKALSPFASQVDVSLALNQVTLENCNSPLDTLQQALSSVGKYTLTPITQTSKEQLTNNNEVPEKTWLATYQPLLLIITYILLTSLIIQLTMPAFNSQQWMAHFMAGFFLVFSFFKMLDIRGFATSYAMYDLLAIKLPIYGFIYPFIELALGAAYLLYPHATATNLATLFIMLFSSIGVIIAVLNKQKIRCACLGSVFNLPMTTVTIIEDLAMAAMAAWMLF